jgi:hypothetical protein
MYRILGADGREYGPVPAEQLRRWIAEGRANAETRVLAEGATDWKPLGSFPEFFTAPPPMAPTVLAIAPSTNGFAVAGLVLGILSLCCLCCYGVPFNLLGLACSIIALMQISRAPHLYRGKGLAVAGLVLCLLSLLLAMGMLALSGALGHWQHPHRRSNWL